ncbi:MAG: hypothetical protein JSU67_08420 [Gammaproteobacteria bacterium]|nr:MAG: hypothetical protein JSU67_08420 [Gammaproteobacteria bacterium]
MDTQNEHLQALAVEQRELIKKLLTENQRLTTLTKALRNRIRELEKQHIVIDREITEIPIDLDLIPERDLGNY